MREPESVTVITRKYLILDAKRPYRIAAGILAPCSLFGAVLFASSDDKPVWWRVAFAALSLFGGVLFGVAAFRPGAKLPLGTTTTVTTATPGGQDPSPPR